MPTNSSVLALDIGEVRVGLAIASRAARLANQLTTLERDDNLFAELRKTIQEQSVSELVVGLPRGLNGQETAQTAAVRAFAETLKVQTGLPVHLQDEAATSIQAEEELKARRKPYGKADIDALAAAYILEDYLESTESASRSR